MRSSFLARLRDLEVHRSRGDGLFQKSITSWSSKTGEMFVRKGLVELPFPAKVLERFGCRRRQDWILRVWTQQELTFAS